MCKRMNAIALPFLDWLGRSKKRRLIQDHIETIRKDIETYRKYGKKHLVEFCEGENCELRLRELTERMGE